MQYICFIALLVNTSYHSNALFKMFQLLNADYAHYAVLFSNGT